MNKIILIGRLTADPETRYTQEGNAVIRFSFAVGRKFKREGEAEADFFTCTIFGKTAERFGKCDIRKGTKLALDGELRNNNYTDRNGVKRYENQIIVNDFEFCESKGSTGSAEGYSQPPQPRPEPAPDTPAWMNVPDNVDDEGLPF